MKILVAVSSVRDWKPQFGISFAYMIATSHRRGNELDIRKIDLWGATNQSCISRAREEIFKFAFQKDYTHLATFDDDMEIPADTIMRLAAPKEAVVFANVCQKIPDKVSGVCLNDDGDRIDSTVRCGLERVLYGTLACTLIDLRAIRHLYKPPMFEVLWDEGIKNYIGEDHAFFKKLGQQGVDFYCDHSLSHQVKHIGDFPYGFHTPVNPR